MKWQCFEAKERQELSKQKDWKWANLSVVYVWIWVVKVKLVEMVHLLHLVSFDRGDLELWLFDPGIV